MSEQSELERERDRLAKESADIQRERAFSCCDTCLDRFTSIGEHQHFCGFTSGFDASTKLHQHLMAEKDKMLSEEHRINGMGQEREARLLAMLAEKDKRIERLREALQKCARANERNPDRGTGGPEYCLSRIDIKAFAEMALQEDGK